MLKAKEYLGYLFAGLILIWHLLSTEIMQRLDWVNFGNQYQQIQQSITRAIQDLDREAQSTKDRLSRLERLIQPPEHAAPSSPVVPAPSPKK